MHALSTSVEVYGFQRVYQDPSAIAAAIYKLRASLGNTGIPSFVDYYTIPEGGVSRRVFRAQAHWLPLTRTKMDGTGIINPCQAPDRGALHFYVSDTETLNEATRVLSVPFGCSVSCSFSLPPSALLMCAHYLSNDIFNGIASAALECQVTPS